MSQKTRSRLQSGFSMVEMLVVLIITVALLYMSYSVLEDAAKTSLFVQVRNDLPVQAQNAANSIQAEVFQASTIFDRDAAGIGPAYLAAVKVPTAFPLLTDSKLPLNNTSGQLVPDDPDLAKPQYVGNCLLLVKQLQPIPVFMNAAKTLTLLTERYQFELYYVTKRSTRNFYGSGYFLDVMHGKSEIYADYTQINSIADTTQRSTVITNLQTSVDPVTGLTTPIVRAWSPGVAVASAFYDLKVASPYTTLIATPVIDMSSTNRSAISNTLSVLPALAGGSVGGMVNYSVAFRPSATTKFQIPDRVPKYATFDPLHPTFPGGVEFLLVGATGSRRLLTRFVLMADYNAGKLTSKEVLNITAVR